MIISLHKIPLFINTYVVQVQDSFLNYYFIITEVLKMKEILP